MIRPWHVVLGILGGCGFSAPSLPEDPHLAVDAAISDEEPAPICSSWSIANDPSLRLCLDFEDTGLTKAGTAADASPFHHDATAINIATTTRQTLSGSQQAVTLTADSRVSIAESANLNRTPAITYGLWMNTLEPPRSSSPPSGLLSNGIDYRLAYQSDGNVVCGIGSRQVVTELPFAKALTTGRWVHVACTFDGKELRVYVSGELARCTKIDEAITTKDDGGTAIGAGNVGALNALSPFIGSIDNVHVYARALAPLELCRLNRIPDGLCVQRCK